MHLLIPIALAVGVAIYAKKNCYMVVFFVASMIAAVLVGMELQEGRE